MKIGGCNLEFRAGMKCSGIGIETLTWQNLNLNLINVKINFKLMHNLILTSQTFWLMQQKNQNP